MIAQETVENGSKFGDDFENLQALTFCRHLSGIHRATSLGGVESLVEHRHTIEGAMTGCPENLIRLSVGIEDKDDLINEIELALSKC